MNGSR